MSPQHNASATGSGGIRKGVRRLRRVLAELWVLKAPLLVLVTLLVLLPLPLMVEGKESRCAYGLIVMAVLWLTEALPIPVTALLPVFIFPMAGVLTAKDVGHSYFSNTSMLFIGGLVVAIGIEECNLHKRVALGVLRRVGADPKWIMLGLMLPTWFLSMWISNTATASMMMPIVEAVLLQIKNAAVPSDGEDTLSITDESTEVEDVSAEKTGFLPRPPSEGDIRVEIHPVKAGSVKKADSGMDAQWEKRRKTKEALEQEREQRKQQHANLSKGLSLCIAYAANVGGIATLTGTPPNLVLKGQVDMFWDKYGLESPLTFLEWMGLGFPLSLILLVVCWLWLVLIFLHGCCRKVDERQKDAVAETIQQEYKAMGSMSFAEVLTTVLFFLLATIWVTREPKVVPGWAVLFEEGYVSDATGAIMVAVLFFILPAKKPRIFCWGASDDDDDDEEGEDVPKQHYQPLLTWNRAQEKLPWGIIVLLGGGFALAKACKFSGLSVLVGEQLAAFGDLDPWVLNALICMAVAMATEVTSNVATATLLMPIMAELAMRVGVNPLYLMSSAALATSFAFMMPVATPPNAIVFANGHLSISDMAKTGFAMNIFAVSLLVLAVNTWGEALFNFSTLPDAMVNATLSASP